MTEKISAWNRLYILRFVVEGLRLTYTLMIIKFILNLLKYINDYII